MVNETARFLLMMDKFFDCVNVKNYTEGVRSRKPFQLPYRSAKDERLKVPLIAMVWPTSVYCPYNCVPTCTCKQCP